MADSSLMKQELTKTEDYEVADRLENCRRDGAVIFAKLLTDLNGVRSDAMDLTDALTELSEACLEAAAAGAAISDLIENAQQLSICMFQAVDALSPEQTKNRLEAANRALSSVQPQSRRLSIVASFSAITSASLGGDGLDHHVLLMRELALGLAKNCQAVSEGVGRIELAIGSASRQIENGVDVVNRIEAQLSDTPASVAATSVLDDISTRTRHTSDTLVETTRQKLRDLISNMQFSDAFGQRLEHVITMLVEQMPGGRAVSRAQVRQLAKDQEIVRAEIAGALEGLERVCLDTKSNIRSEQFGQEAEFAVASVKTGLQVAIEESSNVDNVVQLTKAELAMIGKTTQQTDEMFKCLRDTFAQMNQSAINASLRSRSSGKGSKALQTLANEVQTIATETGTYIAVVQENLMSLQELCETEAFNSLLAACLEFQGVASKCTNLNTHVDNIRRKLERSVVIADKLVESLSKARTVLAPIDTLTGTLKAEAIVLERDAAFTPDLNDDENNAILELYTMDREREIHATVYDLPEEPTSIVEADLDDLGFETF